jgi:NhaC family Na+:H+ antiporter
LGNVLGAGAAVTSPLVPWNNCGVYMTSVLGVKTSLYTPYAFFSYLLPLTVIIYGFVLVNRKKP